jgi:hypothetical protein
MTDATHRAAGRTDRRVATALFLLAFGVYALLAGGHAYSSDEEGLFITTKALVEHRTPAIVVDDTNSAVLPVTSGRDGTTVGVGGFGQSVVAIPLYLVGSLAGTGIHGGNFGDYPEWLFVGWTDAIVTALIVALLYLTAVRIGTERRWAVVLALVYGFCTFAMPHAKTFFSEPLATLLSLLSLFLVVRAVEERSLVVLAGAGAAIGFALHARASVGIFLPILGLYVLWTWAGRLRSGVLGTLAAGTAFGAGTLPPIALLLVSNWWRFGEPLNFGYGAIPLSYPITEGLYGLFLSPGKSVFLYAPVVLLGLVSPFLVPARVRPVAVLCVTLGLANALFFARFPYWHGDHSFGPRYLVMSIPFWVVPVGPLLAKVAWRRALAATAVLGFVVAALGSVMYFNQYFAIAERTAVPKLEILPDGPNYWRKMHYDPYWSPVLGHARALPSVLENSAKRADGQDRQLQTWPGTTGEQYGWYFAPPQLDSWVYWLAPTHGPKRFLVLAPVFLGLIALGAVRLRQALEA